MPRKRSRVSRKRQVELRSAQWYHGCNQGSPGKAARSPIDPYYRTKEWKALRIQVLERDKNVCQYCGNKAVQADHIHPRRRGGEDATHNLVACCVTCNRVAGGQVFKDFEEKKWWLLSHRKNTVNRSHYEETMRLLRKKGK